MRLIDADALMADCQLAQKQAGKHGREFANAFYSGGGSISTEWWCVEDMIENASTIEPEIIRCKECKYAEVADSEDSQDGYTCQFHRGSIWFGGSYCSWAERRRDE